jgi:predicted nucleic acid-binding protein
MSVLRVYADTSVFGGYFDAEFADSSRRFFDAVFNQSVTALISDTLVAELVAAPPDVQELLAKTLQVGCERLQLTAEAITLRDAYLHANVVTAKYADDALHVAQATLARADVIVSWNFKHLVLQRDLAHILLSLPQEESVWTSFRLRRCSRRPHQASRPSSTWRRVMSKRSRTNCSPITPISRRSFTVLNSASGP